MTDKNKFWLVIVILTIWAGICSQQIDSNRAVASPKKQDRSPTPIDRLIFIFKSNDRSTRSLENRSGTRRTKVAGSRGCGTEIVALIPRSYLGKTISPQPTLWFYLGASDREVESMKFTVFGSIDPEIRETWSAQLSPQSRNLENGLLKLKYPGRSLQAGTYAWEFNYQQVGCSKPQTLSGYIQKEVDPPLGAIANAQERWRSYANNGIWHELLDELIISRQQQPNNSQFIANIRSLFFESKDIKYTLAADENSIDRELSEKIVTADLLNCCEFVKTN